MKEWLCLSLINVILQSIHILIVKYINLHIDYLSVLTYMSLMSVLFSLLIHLICNIKIQFDKASFLCGIMAAIDYYLLNKAIVLINNPGIPVIIFRISMIISAILSYFIFNSYLSYSIIIYILIVIGGMYLLTCNTPIYEGKDSGYIISIISAFTSSCTILLMKYITMKLKINYIQIILNLFIGFSIFSIINQLIQRRSLSIMSSMKLANSGSKYINLLVDKNKIYYILSLITLSIIYPVFVYILFSAIKKSSNPGFPIVVISSNVIIITLISTYIFEKSDLHIQEWGGILAILCGTVGVALTNK